MENSRIGQFSREMHALREKNRETAKYAYQLLCTWISEILKNPFQMLVFKSNDVPEDAKPLLAALGFTSYGLEDGSTGWVVEHSGESYAALVEGIGQLMLALEIFDDADPTEEEIEHFRSVLAATGDADAMARLAQSPEVQALMEQSPNLAAMVNNPSEEHAARAQGDTANIVQAIKTSKNVQAMQIVQSHMAVSHQLLAANPWAYPESGDFMGQMGNPAGQGGAGGTGSGGDGGGGSTFVPDPASVAMLKDMMPGTSDELVGLLLQRANGSVEMAAALYFDGAFADETPPAASIPPAAPAVSTTTNTTTTNTTTTDSPPASAPADTSPVAEDTKPEAPAEAPATASQKVPAESTPTDSKEPTADEPRPDAIEKGDEDAVVAVQQSSSLPLIIIGCVCVAGVAGWLLMKRQK